MKDSPGDSANSKRLTDSIGSGDSTNAKDDDATFTQPPSGSEDGALDATMGFELRDATLFPKADDQAEAPKRDKPEIEGYKILETLGRGGMGVVYKAQDEKLNRPVALKVVLAGPHAGQEERRRFRAEATVVARLHHPNIVQVYEVGESNGHPYLSLELVDGPTLAEMLNGQPLSGKAAAGLVEAVARAIHYAHQKDIVHRDLKPANILIAQGLIGENSSLTVPQASATVQEFSRMSTASGSTAVSSLFIPKITDFGLAKQLDLDHGQTRTGTVMGTARYMAPEQASGRVNEIGPATDVYSIGVILYELLVGRAPFVGEQFAETIQMVLRDDPVPPIRLQPRISKDLNTICLKCLEKEPGKRFASAEQLASDLRRYLTGQAISVRAVGTPERAWRWCRRNPVVSLLAALCVLLFASGIVLIGIKNVELTGKNESLGRAQRKISEQLDDVTTARNAAREAQEKAVDQRDASQRREAELTFNKGIELAIRSEIPKGLHWMLQSLKIAPSSPEMADFRRVVRTNVAAWSQWTPRFHRLQRRRVPLHAFRNVISPDEKRNLLSGSDGTVIYREIATGKRLGKPINFNVIIHCLAFLADGKSAVFGLAREQQDVPMANAVVVELASGKVLAKLRHPDDVQSIWQASDPRYLITQCWPETLTCWDTTTWKQIAQRKIGGVIGWRSNRTELLLTTGQILGLPDLKSTAEVKWPKAEKPIGVLGQTDHFLTTEYSKETRRYIMRMRRLDRPTRVSDRFETRYSLFPLDRDRFSADASRVWISLTHGRTRVWEITSGRDLHQTVYDGVGVNRGVSTSDEKSHLAGIWHFHMPRPLSRPYSRSDGIRRSAVVPASNFGNATSQVSFSKSRRWAVVRDYGKQPRQAAARVIDLRTGLPTGAPMLVNGDDLRAIAISPDERLVATGSHTIGRVYGEVDIWDLATGKHLVGPIAHTNYVSTLAFSPDGKALAAGDYHGLVRFWNPENGEPLHQMLAHKEIVWSLSWSHDATKLAVGTTSDRTGSPHVRVWSVADGRPLTEPLPHSTNVLSLQFNSDASLLLAAGHDHVKLWDVATGKTAGKAVSFALQLRQIQFSPDSKTIASAQGDGNVQVWDAATMSPLGRPLIHGSEVLSVAFSPDGTTLASGTGDGNVRLWDLATRLPLGPPFALLNPVVGVTFSPDGQEVLAASTSGACRRWRVPRPAKGSLEAITEWVTICTCMTTRNTGEVVYLTDLEWEERQQKWMAGNQKKRESVQLYPPSSDPAWHMARLADAEEDFFPLTAGTTLQGIDQASPMARFSAEWHLNRLVKSQPDEGSHYLRLGRVLEAEGEKAASAYARARQLVSAERLNNWFRHRVQDCLVTNRWQIGKRYLDELLKSSPQDAGLFQLRALVHRELGDATRSQADEDQAIRWGADKSYAVRVALARAENENWTSANQILSDQAKSQSLSLEDWNRLCIVQLKAGDRTGYDSSCGLLLEGAERGNYPTGTKFSIVGMCAYGPCKPATARRALAIAEGILALAQKADENRHAVLRQIARLHNRSADYDRSEKFFAEAAKLAVQLGSDSDAAKRQVRIDAAFRAINLHHLAKPNEARQQWKVAEKKIAATPTGFSWAAVVQDLILDEANRLLKDKSN